MKFKFEIFAKNFVNEIEKIIEILNNINILIFVKNNCKLNIYIIDKINNDTLNYVDEMTIVIV